MLAWQEPPPYVQYAEEATALARMTVAAGACGRLGYTVSQDAGLAEVNAYVRRAVIDGVGQANASDLYSDAVDREGGEWEFMTTEQPGASDEEADAAMMDGARFIVTRCQAASRSYPAVVAADGDEPASAEALIARILSER